ncbi:MAG: ribonuclease R, partial [Betaproteobacteria bacterium]
MSKKSSAASRRAARALRLSDPQLARERGRYEQPVPSREFILELMAEAGAPLHAAHLVEQLSIEPHETEAFQRRLQAMARDGQIMVNRRGARCVAENLDLVPGRVIGHADGFGFRARDVGGTDR